MDLHRHALAIQGAETMRFRVLQARFCSNQLEDGVHIPEDNMCELVRGPARVPVGVQGFVCPGRTELRGAPFASAAVASTVMQHLHDGHAFASSW